MGPPALDTKAYEDLCGSDSKVLLPSRAWLDTYGWKHEISPFWAYLTGLENGTWQSCLQHCSLYERCYTKMEIGMDERRWGYCCTYIPPPSLYSAVCCIVVWWGSCQHSPCVEELVNCTVLLYDKALSTVFTKRKYSPYVYEKLVKEVASTACT